jgi:hypothetical protein
MGRNRNKYKQCIPPSLSLPELPLHVIEDIIHVCDVETQGRWAMVNRHFKSCVGDVRPMYSIHQEHLLKLLKVLCDNDIHSFFNLGITTGTHRVIISDEEKGKVYLYIYKKNYFGRIFTRCYMKQNFIKNIKNLFKQGNEIKTRLNNLPIVSYKVFFVNIFSELQHVTISCARHRTPQEFYDWKKVVKDGFFSSGVSL